MATKRSTLKWGLPCTVSPPTPPPPPPPQKIQLKIYSCGLALPTRHVRNDLHRPQAGANSQCLPHCKYNVIQGGIRSGTTIGTKGHEPTVSLKELKKWLTFQSHHAFHIGWQDLRTNIKTACIQSSHLLVIVASSYKMTGLTGIENY